MELKYEKKNIYAEASEAEMQAIFAYAEGYKAFINQAKTERDAVKAAVALAKSHGYTEYRIGDPLHIGDKKYLVNRNKNVFFIRMGSEDVAENGVRILAAHIDSPRLDLKQVPLYEKNDLAFFKTHYYGGIRKYQWTALPLALHGVAIKADGTSVEITVGEDESDPVFYVSDLLPHLAAKQNQKTLAEGIEAERLNIWVGGIPVKNEEKNPVKANVLRILHEKYGICEEDLISAELTMVPALKARDVGFDRAQIAAYGHDDKVCAYPEITAMFDTPSEHTIISVLADKEEIGSEGATGMQSALLNDILEEIAVSRKANVRKMRYNSMCLSADVAAAYDPNFPEVFEENNSAMLSCGSALCKFTGSRGKSSSNDAVAEFVGYVRNLFNANGAKWQMTELGKVDVGGGGTVAKFIAKLNIDTIDFGVPVVSMHAPYEVVSKADLYSAYQAFCAFCK